MLQISQNAAQLIKKMVARNAIPDGGLRIGVKADSPPFGGAGRFGSLGLSRNSSTASARIADYF